VGGYSFEEAAKASEATKNFNSADGRLTFAIVTHTAGNGFFDPVYTGAKVAADAMGITLVMLGSEAPVDDIPREIEILNQVIQDPTIDGLILTTPQSGAYDDIVKKMLDKGIPVATTNSYDGKLYNRNGISHTGQDASAAAIGGEALANCVLESGVKGGSIVFPNTTTLGNVEVNNRITAAYEATVIVLNAAGRLGDFRVDAGPENIGVDVDKDNIVASVVTLIESRGDTVGAFAANGFVTPALGNAIAQLGMGDKICSYGFDLGPAQQEQIKNGHLDGSLGQQPFLQGFWPVMQLYLQIDRGIAAANLDTRAQLVTNKDVSAVGKRFEN
jgi:simple sugar transport system substrate-binding protein